jgi:RNA polymerase sporulation-specific sigma factor
METEREAFIAQIRAAQSGDEEAERSLIEKNLPLVSAVAKRYQARGLEPDDLRQLGSIGLLKAIRRFDVRYEVCFSTYAVPLIAGEIRRFLRDDGMIKFSRNAKRLSAEINRALSENPDLTINDLAERLHVSREDLAAALASANQVASLDEPLQEDGSCSLSDRIASESEEEKTIQKLSLNAAIESLTEQEQLLIRLRYRDEKTQSEVGHVFGVSQVQISRMEKKVLAKMRSMIRD